MKLQEKLDELTARLLNDKTLSSKAVSELMTEIENQVNSGRASHALAAGEIAPVFTLPSANGKAVSSQELLRRGPLVINFYRGVWCPYCKLELKALEEARPEIEGRGASLVAISMQDDADGRKFVQENGIGFPVLIDKGGVVCKQFGLRYALSERIVRLNKLLGTHLDRINGESGWALPMPAQYVIGRDGIVAYSEINPDYTQRPDPRDLLSILDRMCTAINPPNLLSR